MNHLINYPVGPKGSGKETTDTFLPPFLASESPRADQMNSCCDSTSPSHYSAALERKQDLLLSLPGIKDSLDLILN